MLLQQLLVLVLHLLFQQLFALLLQLLLHLLFQRLFPLLLQLLLMLAHVGMLQPAHQVMLLQISSRLLLLLVPQLRSPRMQLRLHTDVLLLLQPP